MSLGNYTKKQLEEELRKRKEEENRLSALTPERRLAEKLHERLCHWNHTDGCGWFYGSWSNPCDTRKRWAAKAQAALQITDEETILRILDVVS